MKTTAFINQSLRDQIPLPADGGKMTTHLKNSFCYLPLLVIALLLAACGDDLPNDMGVWHNCSLMVIDDTAQGPANIYPEGYPTRVCGNLGLPNNDYVEACIDQCEDDWSYGCFGITDDGLFTCGPACTYFSHGATGESCASGSILPGPPPVAQHEVTLNSSATVSVAVEDESGSATPKGTILYTPVPCAEANCPFHLAAARLTAPLLEIGTSIDINNAVVQSAGLATGTSDPAGNFLIPAGALRVSVNGRLNDEPFSITLPNDQEVKGSTRPFRIVGTFSKDNVRVTLNLVGDPTNDPPVAEISPTGQLECTNPRGADLTFMSPSTDPQGVETITYWKWRFGDDIFLPPDSNFPSVFPANLAFGNTKIGVGVLDHKRARDAVVGTVTVADTTPPILTIPPDVTTECTAFTGQAVTLGNASAVDRCDSNPRVSNNAPATFVRGTTMFTWTAEDDYGNKSTATQRVHIVDTTPPVLSVAVSPNSLWPPLHNLVTINATIQVSDICDSAPTVRLVSVTSNEPDNGLGDGDKPNDIQAVEIGSDDRSFKLRAERGGLGSGRSYLVRYEASDASGNKTTREATIRVPISQQ